MSVYSIRLVLCWEGRHVSLEHLYDVIDRVVDEASRLQDVVLVDARLERVEKLSIRVRDGNVEHLSPGVDKGVAIRVFLRGGGYGFAYTTRLDAESMRRAVRSAYEAARASRSEGGLWEPILLDSVEARYTWNPRRDPRDVSIDVKVSDLLYLDKFIASTSLPLKARSIGYREEVRLTYYSSSEGRRLLEERGLTYLIAYAVAKEGDVAAEAYYSMGTTKGYAIWDKASMEDVYRLLEKRLGNQLRGKTPKAGNFPVVMAPSVIGVFVHEAFGHLTEADLALSGSIVRDKVGKRVASPLVSIVDDPGIEDGFGSFRVDDEGVFTRKAVLVEKGVLKEFMVDRLYAAKLNEDPTGNARAESFRVPPLIRMRNTVLLPGEHRVEELFEGIKYGYYLVAHAGGQANLDGNFQVGIQEAYEIVNGEIGEPVRSLSITGNTIETLLNIDAVAKDFELHYGVCGKMQLVYVSDGGPHVRVRRVAVGGRTV